MEVLNSCRCCLQAAPDLDLTTPYIHLGKTEIYSNMLKHCFDLHVSLAGNSPCGICFTCVGRLRDASDFKQQVQHSQVELESRLQGVGVQYENISIKVEIENYGSEEEVLSHEKPVINLSETISEDGTPENVCKDQVLKSECSDGVQTLNKEAISPELVPLDSASGTETDPAVPASHYEPNYLGHKCDDSDTSEGDVEECLSDTFGEQDTDLKRYPCGLCDKDFVNKSALKRHQRVIHATEKMYVCENCNKKFTTKDYLDKHKNTHTEESFSCDVCDKIYKKKSDLTIHKVIHIGKKMYKCEKCKKSFSSIRHLHRHQKNICIQKTYVCEVCNKKFAKKMVLKRHLSIHSGLLPYECSECDKRFSRKDLINAHKKIHSEKSYSCEECEKKFFNKRNLLRHKITHSGQKYECSVCNKLFNREDSLKAHQRIHTEGKPAKKLKYTCKDCNKQFLSKTDLSRHARIHTGEKPFACEACKKQFNQKVHLATHLKICTKHLGIQ